jgi:Chemotaxis response regulator containing a CheY-like receiver domain and a methylesterase domain
LKQIRVMAVDDSALMRNMLTTIVNQQADMAMVATAPDPYIARDLIKQLNPDVLTLDIDMPRMDGLEFLSHLMRLRPMPVIMISSMTTRGSSATLNALEHGAVDFIPKPCNQIAGDLAAWSALLADKIRGAAKANPHHYPHHSAAYDVLPGIKTDATQVIAIGSSTGGTEALRCVLTQMPLNSPGIVIAQHMPAGFTRSFAQRMDTLCQIAVREAEHGEPLRPGKALIAPGDRHMTLVRRSQGYEVHIDESPPVNRHRPSVDVLFNSVAQQAGKFASAAILTGMGNDGARGLLTLRQAGAWTLAQNEESCVVFGMPREAIALEAACEIVDLDHVSQRLLNSFSHRR